MGIKSLLTIVVIATAALLASSCAVDDEEFVAGVDDSASHDDADHADAGHDDGDGSAAHDDEVDLVVVVTMSEWGFELDTETVAVGSTVRFDFVNAGSIDHEAMFGTRNQQEEFAAGDHGTDHGTDHGDRHAIRLEPGATGSLVVDFDEPGEMMIGCHIPGHFDAGMLASFTVV